MNIKVLAGSATAIGLLGLGMLAGSVVGSNAASAQTGSATYAAQAVVGAQAGTAYRSATTYQVATTSQAAVAAQAATTPTPAPSATFPEKGNGGSGTTITAKITQQQAEQAALAANPGATVDHTSLQSQNGNPVYDVDFTNGGGAIVDGNTGAIITNEAAGQDQGGRGGHGGRGGADQAALAAQAKITQAQAEQAALAASPGNTVDHSRLGQDANGTIFWDVDFTNGGGVVVNAQTGAIITTEAAGTDQGGHGGKHGDRSHSPSSTPTPQP